MYILKLVSVYVITQYYITYSININTKVNIWHYVIFNYNILHSESVII